MSKECLNCGKPIEQTPKKKEKVYCSASCRVSACIKRKQVVQEPKKEQPKKKVEVPKKPAKKKAEKKKLSDDPKVKEAAQKVQPSLAPTKASGSSYLEKRRAMKGG